MWLFDWKKKNSENITLLLKDLLKKYNDSRPECSNVKASVHVTCIHFPSHIPIDGYLFQTST